MFFKIESRIVVSASHLEHAVPCLYCSTTFVNNDGQCFGKRIAYFGKYSVKTIGVSIVQKIGFSAVAGGTERVSYELRAESGTADANVQYIILVNGGFSGTVSCRYAHHGQIDLMMAFPVSSISERNTGEGVRAGFRSQ